MVLGEADLVLECLSLDLYLLRLVDLVAEPAPGKCSDLALLPDPDSLDLLLGDVVSRDLLLAKPTSLYLLLACPGDLDLLLSLSGPLDLLLAVEACPAKGSSYPLL